jgi:large subunit ribosomal protein L7/L12
MADLEKIAESLSSLTILEASELTKMLEEKWGVTAAAQVAVAAAPAGGDAGGSAASAEEKSDFDVILASMGDQKN